MSVLEVPRLTSWPPAPAHWRKVPFAEIAIIQSDNGKRVPQSLYQSEGPLPIVDQGEGLVGGFTDDQSLRAPTPSVIFGDHTRRVKIVDFEFAVGAQGVKLIRPTPAVRGWYLAYLLAGCPLPDKGYARHFQYLRGSSFPLPPLEEQDLLVDEIEKQFTRLHEAEVLLRRCRANIERYKSRLMVAGVHSDAPRVRVGDLLEHLTSGSRGWAKYYSNEGALFLRIGNLDHQTVAIDLAKRQHVTPPLGSESARTRVQPGDVLISITAELGMVGVVPEEMGEAYINQHLALLRFKPAVVPRYAGWYVAGPGRHRLVSMRRGATKVGLGLDDIRAIEIPLPGVDQQEEMVSSLEAQVSLVDAVCREVEGGIAHTVLLRQSVLNRAFSNKSFGQRTV